MAELSSDHWYPSAAYLYVLHLDGPALAWEYLRRDPDYRRDWLRRHRHPDTAQCWGLRLRHPRLPSSLRPLSRAGGRTGQVAGGQRFRTCGGGQAASIPIVTAGTAHPTGARRHPGGCVLAHGSRRAVRPGCRGRGLARRWRSARPRAPPGAARKKADARRLSPPGTASAA